MCEAEILIMHVEQYPCLWDINHADYHNRDIKDLAWEQICKEVYDDWETCTDKSNKCANLKKRWTNIRDYYRKEVQNAKKVPTGSAAKKSKTYVYSELLYFLTPIFAKRVSEGNYPQEKEEDSESSQTPNIEHNIEPEAINHMESPEPTLPVVKQKRKKDVPSEILNMLKQKQKQTPANTNEDDDTKYLLSFRSYMKTMNAQQKIDFKVGMLNLIKTITMENDPSPPESRYTNYYHHGDNSSGPKISPIYLESPSPPPPTYHSFSQQKNIPSTSTSKPFIRVPKTSPLYLQSTSPSPPTYHSFSQQQNIPSTSTSKPFIRVPKTSPIYLQSTSPSPPTYHSFSQQQNIPSTSTSKPFIRVPKTTPISLQSTSPSPPILHSYSQQQDVPRPNTSRKPIVIHSITNMTPPQSTTQQSPGHDYPELSIPETSAEDSEAAQFLVLQSEDSEKDSIQEFLKFK